MLDILLAAGSTLAALLILFAFVIYNREEAKINTGTWVLLAFGDLLDFGSYFAMTSHDVLRNVVPLCFAVGSLVTFANAIRKRRFAFPDTVDCVIILVDLSITVAWLGFRVTASTGANLAYQATTLIAFVPMYRALAKGTEQEKPLPWLLWTAAYVLFCAIHLLSRGTWEEGVYPAVGLLTHFIVLAFARSKAKQVQPS